MTAIRQDVFRAYDIRGTVGPGFDADAYRLIGHAFGTEMSNAGLNSVAVGYDGRLTSPELEEALVDGLLKAGRKVVRIGRGPSPMLYYATYELGTDAGLMITGSHNPPEFNGIKMTMKCRAFFGDDIEKLQQLCVTDLPTVEGGTAETVDVRDDYAQRMAGDFKGERALSVVWDPGNGAGGEIVERLAALLPGTHCIINGEIDGTFPAHHPDPTVEANLAGLKDAVVGEGADLGIALDGDADRIGLVDRFGRVIWGDQLLVILAREVLADHPGAPILCDVKGSRVFFEEIEKLGGEPVMWKAGHSHIKTKMAELNSPLAGEMSAHIFFKHRYYGFDDALYAAVRLLSILASGKEDLDMLLDALPPMFNTPEIRFDCDDTLKFQAVENILDKLRQEAGASFSDIDGIRAETSDGWWLLRASNTQPMLVVRCESDTLQGLERLKDDVRRRLIAEGIDPQFT